MYAIIETGGKQYRVAQGDQISVERLPNEKGSEVRFEQVLFVGGDGSIKIGTPTVGGAVVVGEILAHPRGEKIIHYRFKRRKGYDKKRGHRQELTLVKIKEIKG